MAKTGCEWIGWAAQLACIFEVLAEKPGNVTRLRDCADLKLEQFMVSAAAVGPAFMAAPEAGVGQTILRAALDTKRLAGVNTNVGILLLLVPLAKAAGQGGPEGLRQALRLVLADLTVEDARLAFKGICLAAPEGLDEVEEGDVRTTEIDFTLREAMAMAKDRDSLASEYVTDFAIVFDLGLPCLKRLWAEGRRFSEAIVQTFLTILAQIPDTDIARKLDRAAATQVRDQAVRVLDLGGVFSEPGRQALVGLDQSLRDEKRRFNPGTTADLVAAAIFAFLLTESGPDQIPAMLARW
jgi:triphosphoribosyl-dephospho-CoA synthase